MRFVSSESEKFVKKTARGKSPGAVLFITVLPRISCFAGDG